MNYDYRSGILRFINAHSGVKGVELVMLILGDTNPSNISIEAYHYELANLVKEGEIVEVEYTLPSMDYRVKSIYFPKGTIISGKVAQCDRADGNNNSL
jgi:hypothetical protein